MLRALPLKALVVEQLSTKFVPAVRATIKDSGSDTSAGCLGSVTFWIVGLPAAFLWGMLMAIAALLPAIGPMIIWVPVALYLLATGAIWQAIVLGLSGVLLIALADKILRPTLVARHRHLGLVGPDHDARRY